MSELPHEFLCRMHFDVDYPGSDAVGATFVAPLVGGEFSGPRFNGKLLAGRMVGSWATGRGEEEGTATLQTDDGVTVLMRITGVTTGDPEEILKVTTGETPDESKYHSRSIVRFEVADERYEWLNATVAIGVVTLNPAGPDLDFYAI